MAVNPKSMSGQDTISMHLRAFTERIPPTGSLREMSGDSDLLVYPVLHVVHVRYRIKQIPLYSCTGILTAATSPTSSTSDTVVPVLPNPQYVKQ